ncbi:MAG: hypothetical protein HY543_08400 [Deltaproteobacteria bacterium]|nr:hypothetical protein [Deltaproteobacteria bacterium]
MRYGMVGNCKTVALIHESGSIDWCCLPNFDHPSAFGALLDPNGGHFRIAMATPCATTQMGLGGRC